MWEQHGSQEEVVLHFIRSFHERTKQPDFGEFLTIRRVSASSNVNSPAHPANFSEFRQSKKHFLITPAALKPPWSPSLRPQCSCFLLRDFEYFFSFVFLFSPLTFLGWAFVVCILYFVYQHIMKSLNFLKMLKKEGTVIVFLRKQTQTRRLYVVWWNERAHIREYCSRIDFVLTSFRGSNLVLTSSLKSVLSFSECISSSEVVQHETSLSLLCFFVCLPQSGPKEYMMWYKYHTLPARNAHISEIDVTFKKITSDCGGTLTLMSDESLVFVWHLQKQILKEVLVRYQPLIDREIEVKMKSRFYEIHSALGGGFDLHGVKEEVTQGSTCSTQSTQRCSFCQWRWRERASVHTSAWSTQLLTDTLNYRSVSL